MATITKRKNRDGTISFLAQVRVKPFKPASRAFAVRKDAQDWAAALELELRTQRDRGGVRSDITGLTIGQLAREFLDDPEIQALRYADDLALLLAWWVNHCGGQLVMRTNVLVLRDARDKLKTGRAPATVNRYLSAMRSCWNWGRASGLIPQDILWPSRLLLREPKGRVRYLLDDELRAVLNAAYEISLPTHVAIVVSLGCGVRQGELLRLNWADVDFKHACIRIIESKNGEARSVHLPEAAAIALKELKRNSVVGKFVFIDDDGLPFNVARLRRRWDLVRAKAGLKDFVWHDLRHSCASFLAQQGASLLEIGSVLGHKSPTVTRRYSHLVAGAPVTGHAALNDKLSGK